MALTATATPRVQHDVVQQLCLRKCVIFRSSFNRANLRWAEPAGSIANNVAQDVTVISLLHHWWSHEGPGGLNLTICQERSANSMQVRGGEEEQKVCGGHGQEHRRAVCGAAWQPAAGALRHRLLPVQEAVRGHRRPARGAKGVLWCRCVLHLVQLEPLSLLQEAVNIIISSETKTDPPTSSWCAHRQLSCVHTTACAAERPSVRRAGGVLPRGAVPPAAGAGAARVDALHNADPVRHHRLWHG